MENVTTTINKMSHDIPNWMTVLPQTVFMISPHNAKKLSSILRKSTDVDRLLVLDAKTDRNGWLPSNSWEFLSNPKYVGQR